MLRKRKEEYEMYYSHNDPPKRLITHTIEVFNNAEIILKETPIASEYERDLKHLCKVAAIAHDFGKYTSFFQDYLNDPSKQTDYKQHSFISALFGSFLLAKIREKVNFKFPYGELIVYIIILHHHGNLRIVSDDIVPKRKILNQDFYNLLPRVKVLEAQIEDMKKNLTFIKEDYHPALERLHIQDGHVISEFFDSWIDTMDKIYRQYQIDFSRKAKSNEAFTDELYYYLLLCYSVLLNADKFSAAGIHPMPRLDIPASLVDDYRKNNFDIEEKNGVNGWRNKIYETVMDKMEENRSRFFKQHIYTLTAPTGAGKTLLSISVACKWRNWIREEKGYTPRIIYALPFTSIIDQNEHVLQKILKLLPDYKENQHRYVVKHHHLTNIQYKKENEELPLHQSLLLIENWESEIIITTFIQLFYTIIGYENRALKKFHQLAGSIVILDEIQNIPVEYWPLLKETLSKLANLFSCKFILLTATQPHIFEKEETVELLESREIKNQEFFKQMERVSLKLCTNEKAFSFQLEEWIEFFKEKFEEGKNYLAIFNTINTSLHAYKNLHEWLKERDYEVYYLSTNIIPLERKRRIEKIREQLKKKNVVVLSTQVVEAGVDLDFDIVYRDLGPIDSIVQSAGRCNRNGQLTMGEIIITPISRNERLESTLVYKSIHTLIAKDTLPNQRVREHEFINLIEEYYNKLTVQKSQKFFESEKILDAMKFLHFSSRDKQNQALVSDFCLIPDNAQMIDTYVEIDEEAKNTWEEYMRTVIHEEDLKKRYEANLQIKKKLRQYIISAPVRIVKSLADISFEKTRIIRIHHDILEQYYNKDFGLIRSLEDGEVWIL